MSDTSNEDKTEQPTPRRLIRAREEGSVARAQGLPGAAIMVTAALFFLMGGRSLVMAMERSLRSGLGLDAETMRDPARLLVAVWQVVSPPLGAVAILNSSADRDRRVGESGGRRLGVFAEIAGARRQSHQSAFRLAAVVFARRIGRSRQGAAQGARDRRRCLYRAARLDPGDGQSGARIMVGRVCLRGGASDACAPLFCRRARLRRGDRGSLSDLESLVAACA